MGPFKHLYQRLETEEPYSTLLNKEGLTSALIIFQSRDLNSLTDADSASQKEKNKKNAYWRLAQHMEKFLEIVKHTPEEKQLQLLADILYI